MVPRSSTTAWPESGAVRTPSSLVSWGCQALGARVRMEARSNLGRGRGGVGGGGLLVAGQRQRCRPQSRAAAQPLARPAWPLSHRQAASPHPTSPGTPAPQHPNATAPGCHSASRSPRQPAPTHAGKQAQGPPAPAPRQAPSPPAPGSPPAIPPEPVHVVLGDPVAQAVHHKLAHGGVVAVEGVAAAAVVVVLPPWGHHVVDPVVKAPAAADLIRAVRPLFSSAAAVQLAGAAGATAHTQPPAPTT
jgi:hypothetical protein